MFSGVLTEADAPIMTAYLLTDHLLNFIAPAAVVERCGRLLVPHGEAATLMRWWCAAVIWRGRKFILTTRF